MKKKTKWKHNASRKLMAVLFALLLLLQPFVSGTVRLNASANTLLKLGPIDVQLVNLLKNNEGLIGNNATLYSEDLLKLRYTFSLTDANIKGIQDAISSGNNVPIPMPDGLKWTKSVTTPLTIGGVPFAELQEASDGTPCLVFTSAFWNGLAPTTPLQAGNISIECKLDMSKIGSASPYTLQLAANDMLTILPVNNSPTILTESDFAKVVNITDFKLFLENTSGSTPISNGEILSSQDVLKLTSNFTITDKQAEAIQQTVKAGNGVYSVYVSMPSGITYTGDGIVPLKVNVNGQNEMQFAEMELYNKSTGIEGVSLRFTGDYWTQGLDGKGLVKGFDGDLFVTCQLDMEAIKKQLEYEIKLLDNLSVTVGVRDNQITPDTLSKSGRYSNSKRALEWTVTYTPGTGATLPVKFKDTLIGDTEYKTGTFKINGNLFNPTITPVNGGIELTYDITESNNIALKPNEAITFTYQTVLSAAAFNDTKYSLASDVTNTAKVTPAAKDNELSATSTVNVPAKNKNWLEKKVTNSSSTNSILVNKQTIDWEVTIYTWGFSLNDLTLHDAIADGLTLVADTVKIDGKVLTAADYSCARNTEGVNELKILIPQNTSGSKYNASYKVTYSTLVDDNQFIKDTDGKLTLINPNFANTAWLTFTWPTGGNGLGNNPLMYPTVNITGVGVKPSVINKKCVAYYPDTQELEWKVIINPYHFNIVNGSKITDDINAITRSISGDFEKLTYSPNSFVPEDGYASNLILDETKAVDENKLTITLNNLGTNDATFTFRTKVNETTDTSYNTGAEYTNTVHFSGNILLNKETVPQNIPLEEDASGVGTVTSTVFTKAFSSYNYETHILTWSITVNQNNMPMSNVSVVDNLPGGQLFVPGSVLVNNAPAADANATVSLNGQTLTIGLGNITTQTTITFNVRVDVDNIPEFRKQTSITIGNSATLKRNGLNDLTVDASTEIKNTMLLKFGTYKDNVVAYSIDINPNGMNLRNIVNGKDLGFIKLKDTLSPDLKLDVSSIKLYKANYSTSSSKLVKQEPPVTGVNYWQYDTKANTFTVTLPSASPYVLTYSCFVTGQNDNVTNSVSFEGSYIDSSISSSSIKVYTYGGKGLLSYKAMTGSIVIEKKDKRNSAVLEGVTFELWARVDGVDGGKVCVAREVTDADGKLTFYLLVPNQEYWLTEIPIDDYLVSSAVVIDSGVSYPLANYKIMLTKAEDISVVITNDRPYPNWQTPKPDETPQPDEIQPDETPEPGVTPKPRTTPQPSAIPQPEDPTQPGVTPQQVIIPYGEIPTNDAPPTLQTENTRIVYEITPDTIIEPDTWYYMEIPDDMVPLGFVVIQHEDPNGDEYWTIEPDDTPLGTVSFKTNPKTGEEFNMLIILYDMLVLAIGLALSYLYIRDRRTR